MKLHILSDLHLEFSQFTPHLASLEADVIILAGDIGVGMAGLEWAAKLLTGTNAHIVYIPGNHEFYRNDINSLREQMKNFCSESDRLRFLDDDEIVINNVRFLGSTLWTDFKIFGADLKQECMRVGEKHLNDFRLIKSGDRPFSAEDSVNLHNHSVAWLTSKLKHEKFDGKTVVVTHHLPAANSVVERYKNDLLSACFASDLDGLLGYSKLWIHGHTHDSIDYIKNRTRVICNPRGYSRFNRDVENSEFDPNLLIEI